MYNQKNYIKFWPNITATKKIASEDLWFIYKENQILLKINPKVIEIPTREACNSLEKQFVNSFYLGELMGRACFCAELLEETDLPKDLEWGSIVDVRWADLKELYYVAIKAHQLIGWHKTTLYCGKCGAPTQLKEDERAKECPRCGLIQYPRISPAVIVGIKKGDQILLAHNAGFREGLYSVLAGFVEQGETLENAVKREVYEEVGVYIKNIKYFESRPWSHADSLMIGFTAEYESGEIKVDNKEIVHADWYDKDHLPDVLPSKISTARAIINHLLDIK